MEDDFIRISIEKNENIGLNLLKDSDNRNVVSDRKINKSIKMTKSVLDYLVNCAEIINKKENKELINVKFDEAKDILNFADINFDTQTMLFLINLVLDHSKDLSKEENIYVKVFNSVQNKLDRLSSNLKQNESLNVKVNSRYSTNRVINDEIRIKNNVEIKDGKLKITDSKTEKEHLIKLDEFRCNNNKLFE